MALYRVQVVHVGYWRGAPHRWNNTFHYTVGSGAIDFPGIITGMHTKLQALGFSGYHGGIAEIKIYASTGGVPVYSTTYFDWTVPANWVPYTGTTGWPGTTPPAAGESAALFEIAAGLSKAGKPITCKTFWHAIGSPTSPEAGAPDFSSSQITILTGLYNALQTLPGTSGPAFVISSPNGSPIATQSTLRPYIVTHQRRRGRRRKALVTASGKYTGPTVKVPPSIIAD